MMCRRKVKLMRKSLKAGESLWPEVLDADPHQQRQVRMACSHNPLHTPSPLEHLMPSA